MPNKLREKFESSLAEAQSRLLDPEALELTLRQLVSEGVVTESEASSLRATMAEQLDGSLYILKNLGAHLAIGAIFAFDVVPLPLGTIARVSWVAGSRLVEVARGNRERARVHSASVFIIAAVPWIGYAAYLLPLRRRSSELAFVLANQTWLSRTGQTYEKFLSGARTPIGRLGGWLIPLPAPKFEAKTGTLPG